MSAHITKQQEFTRYVNEYYTNETVHVMQTCCYDSISEYITVIITVDDNQPSTLSLSTDEWSMLVNLINETLAIKGNKLRVK